MKNSKTALNMLGVSSPLNNGRDTLTPGRSKWSHLLSNIKAKFKNPDFQKDVSTFLNLVSFIPAVRVGKGAHAAGKAFWPKTRNTGDLYANARKRAELSQQTARKAAETTARPKSSDPYSTFTPTELKRVQGMSTPLKPNLTPTNPRGVETVKWAGGREVIKPGTPGRGGNPTYSEKNPLWPTFEGTNLDKILYPKNWK
tara:strand:+ start:96 stop:692 length:597 start_codon:yes stop_codon:yes gene_type:complete